MFALPTVGGTHFYEFGSISVRRVSCIALPGRVLGHTKFRDRSVMLIIYVFLRMVPRMPFMPTLQSIILVSIRNEVHRYRVLLLSCVDVCCRSFRGWERTERGGPSRWTTSNTGRRMTT